MFFHDLKTERLLLRNISHIDDGFILQEFSNGRINRYLFDAEPLQTIETQKLIDFYLKDEPRHQHRWVLILKETGTRIGTCGFHCWNRRVGPCEVGYDQKPAYCKQGYMQYSILPLR